MSEVINGEDVKTSLDRIARTTDGQVLYRYLQKIRMGITPAAAPECALRANEGRRSFAADLMAFMAEGIADSDRACITFAVAKPAPISGRGSLRRIHADTPVAGYDAGYDADSVADTPVAAGGSAS